MKKLIAGLLAGAYGLLFAALVSAASLQDSVGMLYRRSASNDLRFTCTVAAIGKYEILTAEHCVNEDRHFVVTFDGVEFINVVSYLIPRDRYDDPDVDIAILRSTKPLPVNALPTLPSYKVEEGADIVTVGFPLGISKVFYKGSLAGRVNNLNRDNHGYLILQVFGAPGSSGSPVIEVESKSVIGVLVSANEGRAGLPVIYATPGEYVKYLIPYNEFMKKKHGDKD